MTYREDNGRPHPEQDVLVLDLYLKRRKGETRRAGATTKKSMCGTRHLHAEDGHQDDGLESSTHTITRLRNFVFCLGLYRQGLHCCCRASLVLVLQGDGAEMPAPKFRGLVFAVYPFSNEERLCVCNIITTTYLMLRLLLL